MSSFEELINGKFNDSSNELNRIYNQIFDKNYFKDKYIFIDGFNGFVAQEYKLLELIISESKCVTITLCSDSYDNGDNFNLFAYVNNSAKIIKFLILMKIYIFMHLKIYLTNVIMYQEKLNHC